jgi:hypothetical protein
VAVRRKHRPDAPAKGYVIESALSTTAPGDGQALCYTELVRWYWRDEGWTADRKKAKVYTSASECIDRISTLRRTIPGVEFTLAPAMGSGYFRPIG